MKAATAVALTCIFPAMSTLHASAQTPTPATAATSTLSSESNLVIVPALVRNKAGKLIFTLNADDFVLTDDGIRQKVHLEEDTGGEPLALVVLIEAGSATKSAGWHPGALGSAPDRFTPLPAMIDAVVGNVPHRIAVVGFDSAPELLQDFTSSTDPVADAIHSMDSGIDGDGGAAILDALDFSLDLLRKQPLQYRRAILLLSESDDRGSKLKLPEALRAVSDTNTTIYSIAYSAGNTDASQYAHRELPTKLVPCQTEPQRSPSRGTLAPRPPPCTPPGLKGLILDILTLQIGLENPIPGPAHGCMSASDPKAVVAKNPAIRAYDCLGQLLPPLALAKVGAIAATEDLRRNIPETVAHLTGGEYFKLSDAKSLELALQTISNHIPNRYVLSFQPQSPHPGFHLLTLSLPNHIDLQVSARNGYWASPANSPVPRD